MLNSCRAAVSRSISTTPRFSQSQSVADTAPVHCPFFIPRNSRGNLPVYTDIRNGGTRYQVLIRGVDGDANRLARELGNTLFESSSEEAARLKVVTKANNLVITGGRWRNQVVEWLKNKGF